MCSRANCRRGGWVSVIAFVLALALVPSAQAANIIWVSDASDINGDKALDDRGWVDLLRAQGYTVDYKGEAGSGAAPGYWRTLDAQKLAALNGADLVIVSRDTSSGQYNNGTETTQWNSVTKPMIVLSVYLVRSTNWVWFNSTSLLQNGGGPKLTAVDPGHPLFSQVALEAGNQLDVLNAAAGHTSFIQVTSAGNGTILAKRTDNNWVSIVEWTPGVEFYAGAKQTAGGRRMLFTAGRGEAAPAPVGVYNLTAAGEKVFLNAVRYMLGQMSTPAASNPGPADGATDVTREGVLSWTPAESAKTHDVYLGKVLDDVKAASRTNPRGVLVSQGQDATTYDPARLDLGQTYYWRVDEVNAPPDSTIFKGVIWSFTVEPFAYPIQNVTATASSSNSAGEGPENTINGSGLTAEARHSEESKTMWLSGITGPQPTWIQYAFDRAYKLHQMRVWNYNSTTEPVIGYGIKGATIAYSVDGVNWTPLGAAHEFARGPGAPGYASPATIDMGGVVAKYVKITANTNWGGLVTQYGLSEVRFLSIPVAAREPNPAAGATKVQPEVTLSWRTGREAAKHAVYLGTGEQVVRDGTTPVATGTEPRYPASLDLARTYYWRVDEVNDAAVPSNWPGEVWSFSTQEYLVVDDFESYNSIEAGKKGSHLVYETWVDGFGTKTNGSVMGYAEGPSVETTSVYDGKQSVPLFYDNTVAAYSEVTANVADLQAGTDWTKYGIKGLTLRFQGDPNNAVQQMYVKVNEAKLTRDGDTENLRRKGWQMWYIDLTTLGASLKNVTKLTIGFERVGTVGGKGKVLLDAIRLYAYDRQKITPTAPGTAGLQAYYQFEGNTNDSSTNARHGTQMGHPTFVAGKVGQAIKLRGLNDYVLVEGCSYRLPVYSAAVWFQVDGGTGSRDILSVHGSAGGTDVHGILLEVGADGRLRFLHRFPFAAAGTNIYSDARYDDGAWHHAVLVKSVTALTAYVDGQQVGSAVDSTQFDQPLPWITLGVLTRNQLQRYFPGTIDDVRLYDRPLSPEEVAGLAGVALPFDKPF